MSRRSASFLCLFLAFATPLLAQANKDGADGTIRIEALSVGHKRVSAKGTISITHLDGTPVTVDVPMKDATLVVGDLIISTLRGLEMRMNCRGAQLDFHDAPFKILVQPPAGARCAVRLDSGSVDLRSNDKTNVTTPVIRIGSRSTEYGVRVRNGEMARVVVFEGSIQIEEPKLGWLKNLLGEGKALDIAGGKAGNKTVIPEEEIERTASVAAELDIAKAVLEGFHIDNEEAALAALKKQHADVLVKPHDKTARLGLANFQAQLGLKGEARYNAQPRLIGKSFELPPDFERKMSAQLGDSGANCAEAILEWDQGDKAGAREFAKRAMDKYKKDKALSGSQLERCDSIARSH